MLPLFVAGLVGYLLGSIPAAFLIVRWRSRIDIRNAGSGNVGALNSFQVTKSKLVGAGVLVGDLLKGIIAVAVGRAIVPGDAFAGPAVAGLASVVGHNFPVWLRFRGGRGLATAAGVMLTLQWIGVLLWCIGWVLVFLPVRKVNIGNAGGTLIVMIAAIFLPGDILEGFLPAGATLVGFRTFCVLLMTVILVRHLKPIREFVMEKRGVRPKDGEG